MAAESSGYSFYPERIAKIMLEHGFIHVDEENEFAILVRGY